MKRYVISFMNFYEGLHDIREIKANSAKEAMILYFVYIRQEPGFADWLETDISEEEIRICVQEQDCSIAFLEII